MAAGAGSVTFRRRRDPRPSAALPPARNTHRARPTPESERSSSPRRSGSCWASPGSQRSTQPPTTSSSRPPAGADRLSARRAWLPQRRQARRPAGARPALAPLAPARLRLAVDRREPERRLRLATTRAREPDDHPRRLRALVRAGRPRRGGARGAGGELCGDGGRGRLRRAALVTALLAVSGLRNRKRGRTAPLASLSAQSAS